MSEHKSWGHRISRLKYPGIKKCTAPGCQGVPEFRVFLLVEKGQRRLNYCRTHALNFSKSTRIAMPRLNSDDAKRIDLNKFTNDALETLILRAKSELLERSETPDGVKFSFDEVGVAGTAPYAARIYVKDGILKHFFFKLHRKEMSDNLVRVHGAYYVRPGSIVEKRIADDEGEGSWNRYLVIEDGSEVLVAMKGDQDRNALVVKYLQREVTQADLFDSKQD